MRYIKDIGRMVESRVYVHSSVIISVLISIKDYSSHKYLTLHDY